MHQTVNTIYVSFMDCRFNILGSL